MIKKITQSDRKNNPKGTKGKKYKLVSKKTGSGFGLWENHRGYGKAGKDSTIL